MQEKEEVMVPTKSVEKDRAGSKNRAPKLEKSFE